MPDQPPEKASAPAAQSAARREHFEAEARLEEIARAGGGWHWETDAEHRFCSFSPEIERILCISVAWALGRRRDEIDAHGATGEDWQSHLETLRRREPFFDFRYLRRGPSRSHWLCTSGVPAFGEDGEFLGYRGYARDVTPELAGRRQKPNDGRAAGQEHGRADILIADDDAVMRELLQLHLSNAGYGVRVAADAVEAGKQLARKLPDLLITDISKPFMTGRQDAAVTRVCAILMCSQGTRDEAARLGVDCFVAKPVMRDALLSAVARALRKSGRANPAVSSRETSG